MDITTRVRKEEAPLKMRNYGRIIQNMIYLACDEANEQTKHDMTIYIAQCMRQKNAIWNKEIESGIERLKNDIHVLSGGKLDCSFPEFDTTLTALSLRPIAIPDQYRNKKRKR